MDYGRELAEVGRKHSAARDALRAIETERDELIRRAHKHGRMTVRAIAAVVGMSHQRVGQIVNEEG